MLGMKATYISTGFPTSAEKTQLVQIKVFKVPLVLVWFLYFGVVLY
jgi:hypothetical protein